MTRESFEFRLVPRSLTRRGRGARPDRASKRFRPSLTSLEGRALLATITVTSLGDAGAGTLRQAIVDSGPGGTIDFDPSLVGGTISLTSGPLSVTKDLNIQGPGAGALTVDGGGKVGVFAIQPAALTSTTPPTNVTLSGLTIADGSAPSGGGIVAVQANLTLSGDAFVNNSDQSANGGAVLVEPGFYGYSNQGRQIIVPGSLSITGTNFRGNQDSGGGGGALALFDTPTTISGSVFAANTSTGFGGAIYHFQQANPQGTLTIDGSQFTGDQSNSQGFALGGAIFNEGIATVTNSSFANNLASAPFIAQGGAIHGAFGSVLTVTGSTFVGNQAVSSGPLGDGYGGAVAGDAGTSLTVVGSTFTGNMATGGREAWGGAIKNVGNSISGNGKIVGVTISNSTFQANQAVTLDSTTTQVVDASGGALFNGAGFLVLSGSRFTANLAQGGSGGAKGNGGDAIGGAVENQSPLTLTGSTFAANKALAGPGGHQSGFAIGGGFSEDFSSGPTTSSISGTQFIGNQATGGAGIGAATGGGFVQGGGLNWAFSGPVTLNGVVAVGNSAVGGVGGPAGSSTGGAGGAAIGGGVAFVSIGPSIAAVNGGLILGNLARGGDSPAGAAGAGQGGGIYGGTSITLTLSGVPILFNEAQGGNGLSGGNGEGGGLWVAGIVSITDGFLTGNQAVGGSAGQGLGGGVFLAPKSKSTINSGTFLAGNTASTAGNDLYQG